MVFKRIVLDLWEYCGYGINLNFLGRYVVYPGLPVIQAGTVVGP